MKLFHQKTSRFFMLLLAGIVAVSGCKKDHSEAPEAASSLTVDSIQLTIQKATTAVAPVNLGNSNIWFALAGDKLFLGNPSNTNIPQYFFEYSLSTNAFTSKTKSTIVCACGFESKLVTDGLSLYYIGSDAGRYSISDDAWAPINYPDNAHENNGEPGMVCYNNKIYFLSGRDASTKFKYYDIATDSWFNGANGLTALRYPELTGAGNRIYALGGQDASDAPTANFSYYAEDKGWTALPDLPFKPDNRSISHFTATIHDRYIFALNGETLYVYDAKMDKWAQEPLAQDMDGTDLNLLSDGNNLYIAGRDESNDFLLYRLVLSGVPE